MFKCFAVCSSVLRCVAVFGGVFKCFAVCSSVLRCVAVCYVLVHTCAMMLWTWSNTATIHDNFTKNVTPPKPTKSRNSDFTVKIQIKSKSQFVLRNTEESKFLEFEDFGGVAFSVESII